ncbi:type II CRISPR RNA-guided endonuclease Cas9 [Porphyromonas catoniae]|jgi:CRISPR-associated protein, csn1 family|uniref:CRISPR-associated endonuclease Cas9 n=1 Tax=Porphyromonas catoniae ATCC 51270 TaxID=887901 RepID=Z4WS20_9PORP|nr:type II CRISPR RNA-guided endonuclease Cas9 [Porphyromonas catoniae]EWC92088.1 CRISPR-associated protein Cas9/Csn1, subtype II/NMEMI [Porphyromonas catoniae ATCC 51270]
MGKKVLGLDLGVGSIGWCLITLDKDEKPQSILGMGSRIVPLSADDATEFTQGKAITKNKMRTVARTIRKGMDRYQLRREALKKVLREHGMLPDEALIKLPLLELWELRARAATPGEQLSLTELGRVLLHINQKRGYKHAKADEAAEAETESKAKKEKESYVAQVKGRYQALKEKGQTIGQHFAGELRANQQTAPRGTYYTYRIKKQVYPREAYIEEYDRIMAAQRVFYPELLTDALIGRIRDRIIFYQRPLKSCKQLVSFCEFEKKEKVIRVKHTNKEGVEELVEKTITIGPKVAPKSSPIFQVCKVWESIHNIRLYHPDGTERVLEQEEKQKLFDYLQENDKLSLTVLRKELKIKPKDKLWCDKLLVNGIAGNTTAAILRKVLKGYEQYEGLLRFNLTTRDSHEVDEDGVIRPIIDESYQNEPLYKLWHILYSIEDREEMRSALIGQLGIKAEDLDSGLMDALYKIDFVKQGYGNKSAKFICKLLPHLQEGKMYSEAAEAAGVRHSDSMTAQERDERSLLEEIPLLQKNALRQPVVEKILNQMINLVNALKREHGEIDEVRVELARELKMSREEREQVLSNNRKRKGKNETIAKRIAAEDITPTKARIQKYSLWEESGGRCIYCGNPVGVVQFLRGEEIEVEHIIPRSILFDDSMSNKVCACRSCNQEKGNRFAMVYIQTKGWEQDYISRIETLFKGKKISDSKRQRLLMLPENLPEDFIERHLRLTQYISREAQGILRKGIRLVSASEGGVTAKLRQLWGYDNILRDLNLERYRSMGETEVVTVEHRDGERTDERIKDWSKRKDHRHHAVDALIVACTRQSYIQRLNRVNAEADRQEMDAFIKEQQEQKPSKKEKLSLLEHWLIRQPHFTTGEVTKHVEGILVSLRPGKRTISRGRNIYKRSGKTDVQRGVLIPRGALSEETIYGVISVDGVDKVVCKYPLQSLKPKDVGYIVDEVLREKVRERISQYGEKQAFAEPLYLDEAKTQEVRSVRCFTGKDQSKLVPLRYNIEGEAVGFVAPGNNHHLALYKDDDGNVVESIVTFWQAVERARYGLPIVVVNPREVMEKALAIPELPESVLRALPASNLRLMEVLRMNDMFLIGMKDGEIQAAIEGEDYPTLSRHLYRVQKLATHDYVFRYHLETTLDGKDNVGEIPKSYRAQSLKAYVKLNPRKVKIDLLGRISLV